MLQAIPLHVQVDMIFRDLEEELRGLHAGTVFMNVRNRMVATFGVRHRVEHRIPQTAILVQEKNHGYMNDAHVEYFREMAIDAICRRKEWTRGLLSFRFQVKNGLLEMSVNFEENEEAFQ